MVAIVWDKYSGFRIIPSNHYHPSEGISKIINKTNPDEDKIIIMTIRLCT